MIWKKARPARDTKANGSAESESNGLIPSSNRENEERFLTNEGMLEFAKEREGANILIVNDESVADEKNNSGETDK